MSTPASAGPTSRALWKFAELSETALRSMRGPTISLRKVCRVGLSTTVTMPSTKASAYTCQTWTCPLRVSTARASPVRPMTDWVIMSSFRLAHRSAMTPP